MTGVRDWHYRMRPAHGGSGYVAWAAKTLELGEAPTDVARGEVVYFLFDDDEDEALRRLKLVITREANEAEIRIRPGGAVITDRLHLSHRAKSSV